MNMQHKTKRLNVLDRAAGCNREKPLIVILDVTLEAMKGSGALDKNQTYGHVKSLD
jgi:hypothetical protein